VVGPENVEPRRPIDPGEMGPGFLGEAEIRRGVTSLDLGGVGVLAQLGSGVLPDHVQHPKPHPAGGVDLAHQALVEERLQPVEHGDAEAGTTHRLDLLEPGTAGKHRQPVEQQATRPVEEVVAPVDGARQGLLALGQAAHTRSHRHVEPLQDGSRRQEPDA
jgi:hypothetical protein